MAGDPVQRRWTLGAAREILGEVRSRTGSAVEEVEALSAQRERHAAGTAERAKLEQRIRVSVGRWIREMEALGLEVKGPWLVDFDNGQGYYCWKWPEERLDHFHGYEEGFAGRVRIQ